ncbi:hypothetical protein [Caldinitratiruptor microaerophilus]|uniref:Neutral/alkaline non-lysosomal ceramidase N-terminal domain-containing protein n=1 Tax=Caldinitratiruptor microaerophilus TaxID=671077 RepID=A0AA35CJT6_9FIRM|nr:hypothetical protein [Caldinitratiruptor microaerophilus]BDG59678.1 hypothetical protein caldi_07680 [Caldinitratiruptor microaerophilus]
MGLRAGCAAFPVTPPVPGPMGGYAARRGPSRGVADPLWARALVLEDSGVKAALVIADLLAIPRPLAEAVRLQAAPALGVRPEHIVVAATHTHSGPALPPVPPEADEALLAWLGRALASALVLADQDLEPVTAGWETAAAPGLAANRRDPDLPADPNVTGLALWRADGSLKGLLLNHACHPTVLGPSNDLLSADFPGAGVDMLQRALGGTVWVAYAQGAAGDVSCRFTRRAQTLAEVRRLGTILAGAGLVIAGRAAPGRATPLRVLSRTVPLALREFPPVAELEAQAEAAAQELERLEAAGASPPEKRLAESLLEGVQSSLVFARLAGRLEREAEVTALRLGDAALVALPGEPFSALARAIRERSPFGTTFVLGYAGGYIGYVPDREAYRRGGYETLAAWVEPGAADRLVGAAVSLLEALCGEGGGGG